MSAGAQTDLKGHKGEDSIFGGSANDVIYGEDDGDTLSGGGGDDVIKGDFDAESASTDGRDTIDGGDGDDDLYGGFRADIIYGGRGLDEIWGGNEEDEGYPEGDLGDTIVGGPGNDIIEGEAGRDTIYGNFSYADSDTDPDPIGTDKDTIKGGLGDDKIWGGRDNDIIEGSWGLDEIYGEDGDDSIKGEWLADELYGGSGSDTISGGDDNDTIDGGSGKDTIYSNTSVPDRDQPYNGAGGTPGFNDVKGMGGLDCDIEDGVIECAPKAVPDARAGKKNVMLVEPAPGILSNDDPDGDCDGSCSVEITDVTITQAPSSGSLTLDVDPITGIETGGFTYTPATGFTGIVTFQYTITNEHGTSDPATVTLTIENTPPVAVADSVSRQFGGYLAGVGIAAADVLQNDSDENGDTLTTALVGNAVNGTVTRNSDGSFTFFPASLSTTSGSFDYQAFDGSAYSNTVTVTLTLSNPAPVANNDSFSGVMSGSMLPSPISFSSVLANDTDVNDTNVHVGQYTQPSQGSVYMSSNGTFTYTPPFGYSGGTVTFTYTAHDGLSSSNTATVTLTISQALWLSDAPAENPTSEQLTMTQAERMLLAAGQLWQRAGVDRRLIQEVLRSATVVITDLPGAQLGASSGNTIYLDVDAARHGWFVDRTPRSHREFTSDLEAREGSAAEGRVDLLTVVLHEMGHLLGLGHDEEAPGVMHNTLGLSTRRLPTPLDAALVDYLLGESFAPRKQRA